MPTVWDKSKKKNYDLEIEFWIHFYGQTFYNVLNMFVKIV